MQGRHAAIHQKGSIALEPFDVPLPSPTQVLIQTKLSLISPGTERAFYLELPNTPGEYPVYPGYSNVGEVIQVGEGVVDLNVGDLVISGTRHQSHVVAEENQVIPLPADLDMEEAVFFNLIAIAMQGIHKARIDIGESVVVIGAGLIGLFAAQLAQLSGGLPTIIVDLDDTRLDTARQLGIDEKLKINGNAVDNLQRLLMADGATIVVEASGSPHAIQSAFEYADQRGRVILLGSTRGITEEINFYKYVHRKGLTVIGAHEINRPQVDEVPGYWTQTSEWHIALELMRRKRIKTTPLITHRFAADHFQKAYKLLTDSDPSTLGIIIDWQ